MHKNIRLLTWFNFFTDFKLYAPIAIIYFAEVSGSFALGMSIVAFLLGFLADSLSPARALLILQIFQIGNLYIYWKLFKHEKGKFILTN